MFFAIVPAAGRGTRMGGDKLLRPWRGRAIIEHTLAAWGASSVEQVIVVVHPADEALAELCKQCGAEVVVAPAPPPEMKDSIVLGLAAARAHYQPNDDDAWLLAPADMPSLSSAVIDQLIAAHRPEQPAILVPVYQGRRGHPALFPWPLAEAVSRLPNDVGVNQLFQTQPVREIPSTAAALPPDIDTQADLAEIE